MKFRLALCVNDRIEFTEERYGFSVFEGKSRYGMLNAYRRFISKIPTTKGAYLVIAPDVIDDTYLLENVKSLRKDGEGVREYINGRECSFIMGIAEDMVSEDGIKQVAGFAKTMYGGDMMRFRIVQQTSNSFRYLKSHAKDTSLHSEFDVNQMKDEWRKFLEEIPEVYSNEYAAIVIAETSAEAVRTAVSLAKKQELNFKKCLADSNSCYFVVLISVALSEDTLKEAYAFIDSIYKG